MARTFLRFIRVSSKVGLKFRILKGIEEINLDPVDYRWKKLTWTLYNCKKVMN